MNMNFMKVLSFFHSVFLTSTPKSSSDISSIFLGVCNVLKIVRHQLGGEGVISSQAWLWRIRTTMFYFHYFYNNITKFMINTHNKCSGPVLGRASEVPAVTPTKWAWFGLENYFSASILGLGRPDPLDKYSSFTHIVKSLGGLDIELRFDYSYLDFRGNFRRTRSSILIFVYQ